MQGVSPIYAFIGSIVDIIIWTVLYSYRHWQTLSEELGIQVQPKPTLTFAKCLEMGLDQHVDTIAKVAEVAGKEFSIEQVSQPLSLCNTLSVNQITPNEIAQYLKA